jgi:hypothetical protein
LKTAARELGKCKLDLVGVQEVRWEKGDTERAEDYTFFYGQGNGDHRLGTGFFVHKRIVSAVRRVEFVSDRMSYIILRGRWCNVIVLNVHAPCEDEGDGVKDSFCEELGRVFDQFSRCGMKILLGDFSAKVGRENIFKPTIGNESLHEISDDSGIRVVNFATSENLVVKSTMFPHRKFIHVKIGGENIETIKKNTEALVDASEEVGLEVNPEKTKYMLMSRSLKIGQKLSIKIPNGSFEDVAKFRHLGTTLTDQNHMHEEIKSRLNSGNACYRSVPSLLSSCLLSRNLKD